MAFQRGDVVLVPFPFTNQSATKTRPAVVISGTEYNNSHQDIIIAKITGFTSRPADLQEYSLNDWQAAGLQKPSAVKPIVATLEKSKVIHTIGHLSPNDNTAVENLLRRTLEL